MSALDGPTYELRIPGQRLRPLNPGKSVSMAEAAASIPEGHDVIHRPLCRFLDCVRISHLRVIDVGTRFSEQAAEGRFAHGEAHWNARLTEDQVRYIRGSVLPSAELATIFGIASVTVRGIRARRSWRHLL